MSHESVWNSRPRHYGKGSRSWYDYFISTDPLPAAGRLSEGEKPKANMMIFSAAASASTMPV